MQKYYKKYIPCHIKEINNYKFLDLIHKLLIICLYISNQTKKINFAFITEN